MNADLQLAFNRALLGLQLPMTYAKLKMFAAGSRAEDMIMIEARSADQARNDACTLLSEVYLPEEVVVRRIPGVIP